MSDDKKKYKILVTGGAGFIGSNLCQKLLSQGHDVICLDNLITGCKENIDYLLSNDKFQFINGDIRNYSDCKLAVNNVDYVLNLQGDEPNINKNDIINLNNLMVQNNSDIGTLATKIKDPSLFSNENVVKVTLKEKLLEKNFPFALNFFRNTKSNIYKNIYHHIGVYIYKIKILEKFVNFNQTKNEIENRLEQLRALDNGIKINVGLAKTSPISVDTTEDYLALKKIMEYKS